MARLIPRLVPRTFGSLFAAKPLGVASNGFSLGTARSDHVHTGLNIEQVLFSLVGANMNITTDQAFTKAWSFNKFRITRIAVFGNSGASLTAAQGGIYTGASKTGTGIVAAGQAYTAITAADKGLDLTLANIDRLTAAPILSLTTAQGSAATADFYVIGVPLT